MNSIDITKKISELELIAEPKAVECLSNLGETEFEKVFSNAVEELKKIDSFILTHALIDGMIEKDENENKTIEVIVEQPDSYKPVARDLQSKVKINLDRDISGKSRSTGKVTDFVAYFQDRFKKVSGILKNRGGELSAVPISALRASNTGRKDARVVGMVVSKKETKNGHLLVEIEDEESSCACLIPKTPPELRSRANSLIEDEVIAFDGYLSDSLFIVKNIIWPELPIREKKFSEEDLSIALISDLHVGSSYFLHGEFQRFLKFLNGEGTDEERNHASKIKYLLVGGDVVDGIGVYPSQEKYLSTKDIYTQYEIFCEFMKAVPEYIEVIVIPGNHDAVRSAEPQPRLPREYVKDLEDYGNIHFSGNPCWAELHDFKVLMYHGTSADTMIASMKELSGGYQNPEKVAIEYLRKRHLSPVYGQEPIAPEAKDYLVVEDAPDLFHFGHVHKNGYADYRGTTIINSGTWQARTDYQVKKGHVPTPCQLPIYNMRNGNISVLNFSTV